MLPATHEWAYIIAEDKSADIAYLYVEKSRSWFYHVDCNGFDPGDDYYAAGWPAKGFTISQVKATGTILSDTGYWWHQQVLSGPDWFIPGQSGGPVINKLGYAVGLVNGFDPDPPKVSFSRPLSETALCRAR